MLRKAREGALPVRAETLFRGSVRSSRIAPGPEGHAQTLDILTPKEQIQPMKKKPKIDDARLQGIACALGELACAHVEPHLAHMVLDSLGLSIADLEAAGADSFDLDRLRDV
jgi:hypothetical protein